MSETPRAHVESALRRLTDGSLTFHLAEDAYSVVAMFEIDRRRYTHAWSKAALRDDREEADRGVRALLRKANDPISASSDKEKGADAHGDGTSPT